MYSADDNVKSGNQGAAEEPVEIPPDRINPDTLRNMIEEFVTREWSEPADTVFTLDEKVEQVLMQLKVNRVRIVFDGTTGTWNIIPCR